MGTPVNGTPPEEIEDFTSRKDKLVLEDLVKFGSENLDTPQSRGQDGSDSGVEVNGGPVAEVTPAASCASSLISFCCSSEDLVSQTLQFADERELGDGTSEGGSESSSVTSSKPKTQTARRKCPSTSLTRPSRSSQSTSRSRTPLKERSLSRTPLTSLNSSSPKTPNSAKTPTSSLSRSLSMKTPNSEPKPSRNSSRVKSPLVSNSDGRWPSSMTRSQITPKTKMKDLKSSMSNSIGPIEGKSSTFDKYATLPRRRRRSDENLTDSKSFRDPSLNRTASLRRKKLQESSPQSNKSMPPYPSKLKGKTKIYHETSIQTALTSQDIESVLAGGRIEDVLSRIEKKTVSVQVDRRFETAEKLEAQIKQMHDKIARLTEEKNDFDKVSTELKNERELRQRQERRLKSILHEKTSDDIVECIVKEVLKTNDICKKQHQEINNLQGICCTLKRELDRSLLTQRKIMQHQRDVEAESMEIQEFLQAEKSTLADSLDDMEKEVSEMKTQLAQKEKELASKQEECNHLVRISEQLRQEKLSAEARCKAMDHCIREAMLQHGSSTSSASVALSGLGSRLETLTEALVSSYAISEQDLEEIVYHNEAYSSNGSSTPSESSPQHKAGTSFMSAIVNAIKNATIRTIPDIYQETELLAAEPEPLSLSHFITATSSPGEGKRHSITSLPSLSDISPAKISHRASFAASDDLDLVEPMSEGCLTNSESLQNLSQAIIQRQRQEEEAGRNVSIQPPSNNLVDQVIGVDNLVTRLLKVLHIVQMSSDKKRLDDDIKKDSDSEQVTLALREEVEGLRSKLECSQMSSKQVAELQTLLERKEKELEDLEKKHLVAQELLTSNWHKAMAEVRRQYDSIDAALEMLQSIQNDVEINPVLAKVQRELEETNFHSATTLPVSTSQPDLNANASITSKTINGTA